MESLCFVSPSLKLTAIDMTFGRLGFRLPNVGFIVVVL